MKQAHEEREDVKPARAERAPTLSLKANPTVFRAWPSDFRSGWIGGRLGEGHGDARYQIVPHPDGRVWINELGVYVVEPLPFDKAIECFRVGPASTAWAPSSARPTTRCPFTFSGDLPIEVTRAPSAVYFVRSSDRIKIGTTTDLARRLRALRAASAAPLEFIGAIPGGHSVEAELHRRWSRERLHGEWFRPASQIVAFVHRRRSEQFPIADYEVLQ